MLYTVPVPKITAILTNHLTSRKKKKEKKKIKGKLANYASFPLVQSCPGPGNCRSTNSPHTVTLLTSEWENVGMWERRLFFWFPMLGDP